jgi:hypothetical protein
VLFWCKRKNTTFDTLKVPLFFRAMWDDFGIFW